MVSMIARELETEKAPEMVNANERPTSFPTINLRAWRLAGLVSASLQERVERSEQIARIL